MGLGMAKKRLVKGEMPPGTTPAPTSTVQPIAQQGPDEGTLELGRRIAPAGDAHPATGGGGRVRRAIEIPVSEIVGGTSRRASSTVPGRRPEPATRPAGPSSHNPQRVAEQQQDTDGLVERHQAFVEVRSV